LQLNPSLLAVRVEAAQDFITHQDAKGALSLLNETPEFQKQLLPVLAQRNWALWATGDLAEMRKGIDLGLLHGRTAEFLLQDGVWKLRAGKFSEARAAVEEALKINPADVRALSTLNDTYAAQKQNAVALQKVKEYAVRQPKSAAVQAFLGMLLVKNGDSQGARAAFNLAKVADPKFVSADLSLIQMDVTDGKLDDAERRLRSILAEQGSNTLARLWLGNLYATKGNNKAALEEFRRVVAADPRNAEGLNNYAYLLAEVGNEPEEALKYAQKAKELAPENPRYSDTLGWALYRKGLYPMAIRELERATAENGEPVFKYHLAMAYAKVGDLDRGRAVLRNGLKQDPNLAEAKLAQEMLGVLNSDGAKHVSKN
jgi:Tfp pilus assembly protein PilF